MWFLNIQLCLKDIHDNTQHYTKQEISKHCISKQMYTGWSIVEVMF